MAQIIANLTLDTYEKNKIPPLIVPQGDYGSREIVATITTQGKHKSVDRTAAVFIVARRTADNVSEAFGGHANADGTVTVPITQWMLAYPDDVVCHVSVTGDGYQYSTNKFLIEAQEKDTPNEVSADDPDVDFVAEVLANENARQEAEATRVSNENARKTAEDARQSAETQRVTDESTRITNEAQRVSAEASRDATFKSWANDIALLPDMSARISRNSKRLDGLEQRINPSPFVTDSSVAYQKDVPQNAVGAVEIQKIGGMTYKDGNTLKSAKVTEVKSVGANLFNPAELNLYENSLLRSGYIPIVPNGKYTISIGSSFFTVVNFYDANKAILAQEFAVKSGTVLSAPNDAYFLLFIVDAEYGTEYKNDIMLNKGSTALPYAPYVKHTLPIPEAVRPANGINENVYDYIEWAEEGSVKQGVQCGVVDLGTLDWAYSNADVFFYVPFPQFRNNSINAITSIGYLPVMYFSQLKDKTFEKDANGNIYLKDSAYTDAATFKAAMSGVMLVYELAEPIITDISDLITSDNLLSIQGGGTQTFENEHRYAVPSTVEYITAEASA